MDSKPVKQNKTVNKLCSLPIRVHHCLNWAIWMHLVMVRSPGWVSTRQFWVLYLGGTSDAVTTNPGISDLSSVSPVSSRVFGAGKYLDSGTYPGSLGPYYFPLRLPLPFPMDDTKQSQSLFENRGAANHQLRYIQNLFMLGVLLQTFTITVVKDCCRQKNFSCQKTFYRIS